jgi:hypothetical protein
VEKTSPRTPKERLTEVKMKRQQERETHKQDDVNKRINNLSLTKHIPKPKTTLPVFERNIPHKLGEFENASELETPSKTCASDNNSPLFYPRHIQTAEQ